MSAQKVIGGRTYAFGTLPATEAVKVEIAVIKAIGEPLFSAFAGKGAEEAGALAIGLLTSRIDPDELLKVLEIVFSHVTCEGRRIDINATFTGRLKEMHLVFLEALKVNFADFLPASLSGLLPGEAQTT
jgi:hypothetical protein